MSFQLKGNIITLKKDKGESLEQYSRIHINVNDNKSEYGPKVMNKLKEYEKNLYV